MGVRINAIFDYRPIGQESAATFAELVEPALPALCELKDYWALNDSPEVGPDIWIEQETGLSYRPFSLSGPGGIRLDITPRLVWLHAAGRWSGFMSMPDLRQAHLKAIRTVAHNLRATFIAYFADCDDMYDFVYENKPADLVGEVLIIRFGKARTDVDVIDLAAAELRPTVWYYEKLASNHLLPV